MNDVAQSKNLKALKDKLREMFQLDQADLDFGIYRIMNAKRDEVERFLDHDLLPQVKNALEQYQPAELVETQAKLEKAIEGAKAAGIDPETAPSVKKLREEMTQGVDVNRLEEEVYSHLATFFSRYYHGGDFMSLRRYKAGVYALPYEGEEVKLHWANADQYYIKSSESFQSYAIKVPQTIPAVPGATGTIVPRRVRFDLASAGTERDNVKASADKERRFILDQDQPLSMDGDELIIHFHYQPDEEKRTQKDLNTLAVDTVLGLADDAPVLANIEEWSFWKEALAAKSPTKSNADRTVLDKHLNDYTAKNSFDYFIHKDLGGFLRRELDFFIKNEIMFLDDIESNTAPRVEQYLSKIKVLRSIAHKFIDFLAQLEDFQKKLWLKKKFVLETNWLVTLNKVPEDLFGTIVANADQREEWVKLFAIDGIKGDLGGGVDYAAPLTVEFLKANPFLVLDTAFFDDAFKDALLASFEDIDEEAGGLLVHGENFQALNLLHPRYREQVKCIYIDPPYNTDAGPINYKNGYKSSSWATLINDRLSSSIRLLQQDGNLCATIDDFQQKELGFIIESTFGKENIAGTVSIRINPSGRPTPSGLAQSHEYAIFAHKSAGAMLEKLPRSDAQMKRYKETDQLGNYMWELFRKRGSNSERKDRPSLYYPIYVSGSEIRVPEMKWDERLRMWTPLEDPNENETVSYPLDDNDVERTWRWKQDQITSCPSNFLAREKDGKVIIYYKFRPSDDGVLPLTSWSDAKYSATEHGTGYVKNMFKEYNVFSYPKSIYAVEDCVSILGLRSSGGYCLDYFGGSGTTAHAVMNLNRKDHKDRRYILVEMGEYFDPVTRARIQKAAYSSDWKDGNPISRDGISHLCKYIRLESYEDCLDNLTLSRTPDQQKLVDEHDRFREDYMLRYMLDVEAKGSVLDLSAFADPFGYKLSVVRDDERKAVSVDLVETFNYLLGLRVKTRERVRDVLEITGTSPDGERVLVLWRTIADKDNDALDDWFQKRGYNARDMEFDVIYVNGDNNIENLRRSDETWKVRLTEEAFHTLMFDVEGE